ncbi:MAG: hypothetical protein CMP23_12680 [Rickettsiales bacterium]|nr:hypothetical protein [Rickettsiales bacterium]
MVSRPPLSRSRQARALAFTLGLSLLVVGLIALLAAEKSWASLMARGLGHLSFLLLGLILLSSPLARFYSTPTLTRLVLWRRPLGIATLVPATVHFALVIWSTPELLEGVIHPLTDLPGMVAFLLLLWMGFTSRRGAQQRLGPGRWKRLHRRAILAAFALTAPAAVGAEFLPLGVIAVLFSVLVLSYRLRYYKARERPAARLPADSA